jgi:hypothetical protein
MLEDGGSGIGNLDIMDREPDGKSDVIEHVHGLALLTYCWLEIHMPKAPPFMVRSAMNPPDNPINKTRSDEEGNACQIRPP